jgi:hypothetical protein
MSSFPARPAPITRNSSLTDSFRNFSLPPTSPNDHPSERAHATIAEQLVIRYARVFILWVLLFICAVLSYLGVMIWALVKFGWGKEVPSECAGVYTEWMWVFTAQCIANATLSRFIKYKLGYVSGQPEPPAVKKYDLFTLIFSLLLNFVGLCMVPSDEAQACRHPVVVDEETGDVQPGDTGYFWSWVALCSLGIFVQFLIWGGLGMFTFLAVWLARHGYLSDSGNAAPAGTAMNLKSVTAAEASDGGDVCSICLDAFVTGGDKPKKTPCGHFYHEKCLGNWFKVSRTCPVCRVDVVNASSSGGNYGATVPESMV